MRSDCLFIGIGDIGEIDDHHCLNFLFIIISYPKRKTTKKEIIGSVQFAYQRKPVHSVIIRLLQTFFIFFK